MRGLALAAPLAIALLAAGAGAQDLEPRAYANTPVGLNFAIVGYAYSQGDVATDAAIPLEDGEIETHSAVLAYARALDVGGLSAKVDVIVPFGWTSGSASYAGAPVSRTISGFGDPRLRFSLNFHGAPALSAEEFAAYEQDVIVGASLQVGVPIGQYDGEKLLNVGNNRWLIKPELGVSKRWGPLILELTAAGTFYTDNDDFLGGRQRDQDPIYSAQAHAIYAFRGGLWASADFTYYGGGRASVDGAAVADLDGSTRVGATVAVPLHPRHSIKLYGSTGVSTRTGGNFDLGGIAWQVRWGAGI